MGHVLSDKYGRKTMYLTGAVAMGLLIGPAFMLINTGVPATFILAVVLIFGIAMSPAAGVTGSLFSIVIYLLIVSAISVTSVALLPGGWGRKKAARQNGELQETHTDTERNTVDA